MPRRSTKLQSLQIFNQGEALVGLEQRADDALTRSVVELVAGVGVPSNGSVKPEPINKFLALVADVDRIVFAIAKVEDFRTLFDRGKQGIEIWDGAVVQIRWSGPNAVERPSFVLEQRANAIRPEAVHFVAKCGRSRWDLVVVPAIHNGGYKLPERAAEIGGCHNLSGVVGDSEAGRNGDS